MKIQKCHMVYKLLNGLVPPYIREMSKFVSDVSKRNNRCVDKANISSILQTVEPAQQQKCGIIFPAIYVTVNQ